MTIIGVEAHGRDVAQNQSSSIRTRSEVRHGMRIDWDAAIPMEDGIVLRCDVFRPEQADRYAVLLSAGPYAKGLAFQERAPYSWERLVGKHPEVTAVSSCQFANWEVVDPEQWVADGYAVVRIDVRAAATRPAILTRGPRAQRAIFTNALNGRRRSRRWADKIRARADCRDRGHAPNATSHDERVS